VATQSWAASHKTLPAHLRKAVDEADNWMAANPAKVGPILLKYTAQSAAAVQETLKTLPGMSTAFTQTQFNEWVTVLKTVVPNFHSTVTYSQLGAGVS
jgi:ABC-type nitrate/sulfonate/bicarbonate transport system substrate-binding protein